MTIHVYTYIAVEALVEICTDENGYVFDFECCVPYHAYQSMVLPETVAGSTMDDRLEAAFLEFSSQCKRHKISFSACSGEGFLTGSYGGSGLSSLGNRGQFSSMSLVSICFFSMNSFVFRFWAQETCGPTSWAISNHCPKAFQWSRLDLSWPKYHDCGC